MAFVDRAKDKCREKTAKGNVFACPEEAAGYLAILLGNARKLRDRITAKRLKKTLEIYRCECCRRFHVGSGAKKYRIARKYRKLNGT